MSGLKLIEGIWYSLEYFKIKFKNKKAKKVTS